MGDAIQPVRVDGLRDFQKALRAMDSGAHKQLRLVLNEAADIVIKTARPRIPRRTGKAAASLKASSSQTTSRVKAGSASVAYYPWLDFGGRVGPKKSVLRKFEKDGRYIYPAYHAQKKNIQALLSKRLDQLAADQGLKVDQ